MTDTPDKWSDEWIDQRVAYARDEAEKMVSIGVILKTLPIEQRRHCLALAAALRGVELPPGWWEE